MNPPRKNPLTRPATALFIGAWLGWLLVLFLVVIGELDLPAWLLLAGPVFVAAGIFVVWIGGMLALTAFYTVLARFPRQHPRRPPR